MHSGEGLTCFYQQAGTGPEHCKSWSFCVKLLSLWVDEEGGVMAWLKSRDVLINLYYPLSAISLSNHLSLLLRLILRTERLPPFVFISILANRPLCWSPWETAVIAKIAVD